MNLITKIFRILEKKLSIFFIILIFLMVIGSLLETIGITLVVPIILTILEADSFQFQSYLDYFLNLLGFKNKDIISMLMLILIFYIVKNLFLFFLVIVNHYFVFLVHNFSSLRIYKNYLSKPYRNIIEKNTAILIRNANDEPFVFQESISQLLLLLTEIFIVIGILALIFIYEPQATFLVLTLTALISSLFYYLSKKYYKVWGEQRIFHAALSHKIIIETFKAFKEIKIYQKTQFFFKNFRKSMIVQSSLIRNLGIFANAPKSWLETFGILILFSIVYFYVNLNKSPESINEALVLFSFCAIRLLPSLTRIINHFTFLRFFNSTVELMYSEIYLEKTKQINFNNKKKQIVPPFTKNIKLDKVSFLYNKKDDFKLKNINLEIEANKFIGIVGKSGSGKSTLVDILLGLLVPDNGYVSIDDNKMVGPYAFKENWVSYVPQNVYLIDDTIKNNITIGNNSYEIDDSKLNTSIKSAGLHSFIKSLYEGENTIVGDSGVRLSGGQIQRIGIARALYNNPKLIILDESTSALDILTENEILNSISNLRGKLTVIIISHRENTLKLCDTIYKIENGKII